MLSSIEIRSSFFFFSIKLVHRMTNHGVFSNGNYFSLNIEKRGFKSHSHSENRKDNINNNKSSVDVSMPFLKEKKNGK